MTGLVERAKCQHEARFSQHPPIALFFHPPISHPHHLSTLNHSPRKLTASSLKNDILNATTYLSSLSTTSSSSRPHWSRFKSRSFN